MNDAANPVLARELDSSWTEVGRARPHESALLHVLGQATYTDDIRETAGTLHAPMRASSASISST